MLSCGLCLYQTPALLTISQIIQRGDLNNEDGGTESVFPIIEELMFESNASSDIQKAIGWISAWNYRKQCMKKYRSLLDYFFCELFDEWRSSCLRFYKDEGPQLIEVLPPEEIEFYQKVMLLGIKLVLSLHHDWELGGERYYWFAFKEAVNDIKTQLKKERNVIWT